MNIHVTKNSTSEVLEYIHYFTDTVYTNYTIDYNFFVNKLQIKLFNFFFLKCASTNVSLHQFTKFILLSCFYYYILFDCSDKKCPFIDLPKIKLFVSYSYSNVSSKVYICNDLHRTVMTFVDHYNSTRYKYTFYLVKQILFPFPMT